MNKFIAASAAFFLSGCAMQQTYTTTSIFDSDTARARMLPGHNIIEGSALIRQRGGGVVTCAGNEISLTPVTAYSRERMWVIYGNGEKGFRPFPIPQFDSIDPEYLKLSHRQRCDAQGNFSFSDVGDGDWYVTTGISWSVDKYDLFPQGGALMQFVSVHGADIKRVVLAPN